MTRLPKADPMRDRLAAPVALLRGWNHRWSGESVAQTVANFWADKMWRAIQPVADNRVLTPYLAIAATPARQKLEALDATIEQLKRDFGRWQVPWGEVNRFQRISPAIDHPFNDAAPSFPVPFASARWGSLASFGAGPNRGPKNGTGITATASWRWSSSASASAPRR